MGLFSFRKGAASAQDRLGLVGTSPSPEYPDPVPLFEETVERHFKFHMDGGWATFEAQREGGAVVVQVVNATVNTCKEPVRMAVVLERAGLSDLAKRVSELDHDLFKISSAGPHELAQAVDAVFRHHYGLPIGYTVRAEVEG
ncbi:MAG: hypothetical protein IT449_04700 [Phycisphaerales bacterium]|nr:hypothetical protein [Phycisphaerales bacterium]